MVRVGSRTRNAVQANCEGDFLAIGFGDGGTRLTYEVTEAAEWIAFRLIAVAGPRPQQVTLLQLPIAITEHAGSRLNAAQDGEFAVCLRG